MAELSAVSDFIRKGIYFTIPRGKRYQISSQMAFDTLTRQNNLGQK